MDDSPGVDDLLQETQLISEEEQVKILRDIDDEFRSYLHHERDESGFSARSRGVVIPLIIGLTALLTALVVIGIIQATFYSETSANTPVIDESGFSTQWQILSLYLEESETILREKDAEIEYYRKEIRAYDERIASLRELLRLKDETQSRLFNERQKLSDNGLSEPEINEQLSMMEREVIVGLSPEIVEFYDLSIEEINAQIDRLLNQRESNESRLVDSLTERELLEENTSIIEEDLRTRESETYVSDELGETIDHLNRTISGYERQGSSRSEFAALYGEILELTRNGEYESALIGIAEIETLIQEMLSDSDYGIQYDPDLENQVVVMMREYINLRKAGDFADSTEFTAALEDDPAVSKVGETDDIDFFQPILVGTITKAEFNTIKIRPVDSIPVETDEIFLIFRSYGSEENREIGSGVISTVTSDEITGRLQSLVTLSSKPEVGDTIIIRRSESESERE